jgi:hypothetical protein
MAEPKKKVPGLAGILIGIGKKKPKDGEGAEAEGDDMGEPGDGEQAMRALKDAFDADDMAGAYSALEDAVRLCQGGGGGEYAEDEESGE